jgi:hypothetical protein
MPLFPARSTPGRHDTATHTDRGHGDAARIDLRQRLPDHCPDTRGGFRPPRRDRHSLVCLVAFLVGMAVRHNIRYVEGFEQGEIGLLAVRLRALSAGTIALAYAISVGLHLQIMAS